MQPVKPCSEYETKNVTEGRGKYGSAVSKGIVCLAKNLLTSKSAVWFPAPPPPPQAALLDRRTMSKLV